GEDGLKLRTKWLGDLTVQDQAKLEEDFELAYDLAEQEVAKYRKKNGSKNKDHNVELSVEKKKEISEKKLKVVVKLYIDQITQNNILTLKKLFLDSPGHVCIDLDFYSEQEQLLGQIVVNQEWGVRFDSQLERMLKNFSFVKSVQLTSIE
ncbi:MAG: hypothetical protein WCG10_03845, partial [Chlamydiota bacterium]